MSGGEALQAALAGLSVGAVYGLVGIGFTLIWALARVLPFAHGDVVVAAVLLAVLAVLGDAPAAGGTSPGRALALVLLTLALAVALSLAVYAGAVRPFLDRASRPTDLLGWVGGAVTAGLVLRTAVGVALPAAAYAVPDPLRLDQLTASGVLRLPGGGVLAVRALPVLGIALAIAVLTDRFLLRARLGRALRAVAADRGMAAVCGVPVERVVATAFAVAGLLAGAAALLAAPAAAVPVDGGVLLGLAGAAGALLGGLGSPRGALLGGLAVGVLQQYAEIVPGLGAAWSTLVPLLVLAVVVAVRPQGLGAAPRREVE